MVNGEMHSKLSKCWNNQIRKSELWILANCGTDYRTLSISSTDLSVYWYRYIGNILRRLPICETCGNFNGNWKCHESCPFSWILAGMSCKVLTLNALNTHLSCVKQIYKVKEQRTRWELTCIGYFVRVVSCFCCSWQIFCSVREDLRGSDDVNCILLFSNLYAALWRCVVFYQQANNVVGCFFVVEISVQSCWSCLQVREGFKPQELGQEQFCSAASVTIKPTKSSVVWQVRSDMSHFYCWDHFCHSTRTHTAADVSTSATVISDPHATAVTGMIVWTFLCVWDWVVCDCARHGVGKLYSMCVLCAPRWQCVCDCVCECVGDCGMFNHVHMHVCVWRLSSCLCVWRLLCVTVCTATVACLTVCAWLFA